MRGTITSLDKTTPPGKRYTLCTLGFNSEQGAKTYKIFGFKPGAAELIAALETAGVGATGDLKMAKNDRGYWDPAGFTPDAGGGGGNPTAGGPAAGGTGKPMGKPSNEFRKPDEIIATSAVEIATELMGNKIAALAAGCTKAIMKTKVTGPLLLEELLEDAAKIQAFIKGDYTTTVTSDGSDLDPNQEDPAGDDIPF